MATTVVSVDEGDGVALFCVTALSGRSLPGTVRSELPWEGCQVDERVLMRNVVGMGSSGTVTVPAQKRAWRRSAARAR